MVEVIVTAMQSISEIFATVIGGLMPEWSPELVAIVTGGGITLAVLKNVFHK